MNSDVVQLLYKQFVKLRQAGYGRNDAWFEIEDSARELEPIDQKRLTSLLQRWEQQLTAKQDEDPYDTQEQPPDGWEQARQYAAQERRRLVIRRIAPTEDDDSSFTGEADTSDVAGHLPPGHGIPCPNCQKMNEIKAAYCYSCGTPMGASVSANATRPLAGAETDNAHFDANMILYLKVQDNPERLRVDPGTTETILGRKTVDSVMIPDIDLERFGAGDHGVSRLHASLRRQNETVVMTDLGSKNHTHINGQRLHAHEVRVLHDGDEIRLGQLVMNVYFTTK